MISQGLFLSEQFQLLRGPGQGVGFGAPEIDDFTVLLIRNSKNANLPFWRDHRFDAFYMDVSALFAGTMTHINRILHHGKPVFFKVFPKLRGCFSLGFLYNREVKKYKQPHDMIRI